MASISSEKRTTTSSQRRGLRIAAWPAVATRSLCSVDLAHSQTSLYVLAESSIRPPESLRQSRTPEPLRLADPRAPPIQDRLVHPAPLQRHTGHQRRNAALPSQSFPALCGQSQDVHTPHVIASDFVANDACGFILPFSAASARDPPNDERGRRQTGTCGPPIRPPGRPTRRPYGFPVPPFRQLANLPSPRSGG